MGDSVTAGFGRGFAFAASFAVTLCSTFSGKGFRRFSYIFVNSVHNMNPRSCSVSKQRLDQEFNTATFLMKTDLHIQDRSNLSISKNLPSHSGCLFTSM